MFKHKLSSLEHICLVYKWKTYFLVVLLRRGDLVSLSSLRRGGEIVKDYISTHCRPRSQPTKDGKFYIKDVVHLSLRTILFIITRLAISTTLHLANRSQMKYDLECIELTVFNWSKGVLENMKEILTKSKDGQLNNFGYGSILISFSLEWIPLL